MSDIQPFHLAFPVKDLDEAYQFYHDLLGCETGRSSDSWIDFNMWGHQVVAHLSPKEAKESAMNTVDGKGVPVRHFGVILEMDEWKELADKLETEGIDFVIEPYIRFEGEPGEQATMFFLDPSGNALEFKAFANKEQIFAT
ncbi:VOC family protein [Gracilimonas sp.]|uniref:VOC family protein n=1 Tax=Gracilimonas sp. TaxID=1974203 RepID=UPI0028723ADC|nr:VOC family protein [Gracilimonas sp.]